jgi:hypothetical protein
MHHPTDVMASAIGAAGCLTFALLATRTGAAVAERDDARSEIDPGSSQAAPILVPAETSDVKVVP